MIRKDIWSVKEWDTAVEPAQYIHSRMFRSAESAFRFKRENQRGEFHMKIVHPADWVVDAYMSLGNEIYA